MSYIALTLPGGQTVQAPAGLPQGGLNTLSKAISNAITIMLILTVVLSLIFLVLGGIGWITSGGDKQKVGAARRRITFAIVGLVVAFLSFFVVSIVGFFFNVKLL